MTLYEAVEVYVHHSWPQHQTEVIGQLHAPEALPPQERAPGWVGPRAGLDGMRRENSYPYRESKWVDQPAARRYTDWAVPALNYDIKPRKIENPKM
jgi:hypothetical protein